MTVPASVPSLLQSCTAPSGPANNSTRPPTSTNGLMTRPMEMSKPC